MKIIHFYDEKDSRSYCVLRPAFVKAKICSWIGDVRDAFIEGLEADDELLFQPLSEDNASAMRESLEGEQIGGEAA